ncbi:PREDICTED: peptidyl-prolyl cis-trans isomerase FKBP17-2, chloroplastic-like [Camelina sativa]|uniref:peptidylprolyl isomerase n=1 Tax=Camelina sativa TaxID=90675 RepID=A0ABM0VPX5_CAMSA|nr:PREDICTED: peptidyl-prolyl cis-trans isomerase FKBP17-2, chloroplastic-like [Camelina sativa]XP_010459433.1 PREDICTED: peptidyl-prolyl cis-trans isomerase FKBP17-2, chloroplastic-like [Camelina sativa]
MANLFTATAPFLRVSQPFTKTTPSHHLCYASSSTPPEPESSSSSPPRPPSPSQPLTSQQKRKKTVETTDWIASSLTRRFGIGAGLAWAGFLAFGVISEQIKTRIEVSQEVANTRDVEEEKEIVLPNGIRYYDLRVGGGATPRAGDLVVIDLKGQVQGTGQVVVDTFGSKGKKKPLALVVGSKPYSKGLCEGIDYILRSMKAGGKRRVIVPPSLGFGEEGAELESGLQIPPNASLEYVIEIDRVSIAPA